MVAFKGRSGPIIKTVTRTVSDIIFDSIEDTKIDYTNYYYNFNTISIYNLSFIEQLWEPAIYLLTP